MSSGTGSVRVNDEPSAASTLTSWFAAFLLFVASAGIALSASTLQSQAAFRTHADALDRSSDRSALPGGRGALVVERQRLPKWRLAFQSGTDKASLAAAQVPNVVAHSSACKRLKPTELCHLSSAHSLGPRGPPSLR